MQWKKVDILNEINTDCEGFGNKKVPKTSLQNMDIGLKQKMRIDTALVLLKVRRILPGKLTSNCSREMP